MLNITCYVLHVKCEVVNVMGYILRVTCNIRYVLNVTLYLLRDMYYRDICYMLHVICYILCYVQHVTCYILPVT